MKTIYTFLVIMVVGISNYAQNPTTANKKNGTFTSGITAEAQTFSLDKVYPNPVKDFVTIELRSEEAGEIQVRLINILGTEVKKWEPFYLNQGDQKLKLDLSPFRSGVYILKITKLSQVRTHVLKKN
jgi:hypothetical protein